MTIALAITAILAVVARAIVQRAVGMWIAMVLAAPIGGGRPSAGG